MINQNIVNMYAHGSRVDLMVAERDVVLTYILKILSDAGISNLIFKGGTCIRKIYLGAGGRFSEDLDFQAKSITPAVVRRTITSIFRNKEYYGIRFTFDDDDTYETIDSLGINITYSHHWNPSSVFKFQISFRGDPILGCPILRVMEENYAKWLEFSLPIISCMAFEEIVAEKIRAAYQRATVRDLYDLYRFSSKPFNHDVIRTLVVLKMWEIGDYFNPASFLNKLSEGTYNWYDIERLIRPDAKIKPESLVESIKKRFKFVNEFTEEELNLLRDVKKHGLKSLQRKLVDSIRKQAKGTSIT